MPCVMLLYIILFRIYLSELQEMLNTVARKEASGVCELYIGSLVPYKNNLSDVVMVFTNSKEVIILH